VTATLSPENKALVLAEYLQRTGQLGTVAADQMSEDEVLHVAAGFPFHLLHGRFDQQRVDDKRARLRSEALNSSGAPLLEVPLLDQHMLPDQNPPDLESEFVAQGALTRIMARPSRLVASPIAIWFAYVSPLDYAVTYWRPRSQPLVGEAPLAAPEVPAEHEEDEVPDTAQGDR
jgi:hypothetical protein